MNMPHSGGGGSHGGGSHGGSHGGSSHRTSHHYFYGARRYRRHYRDGRPDEYFYSNGRPQKTSLFSIIFIMLFGVVFSGLTFLGTSSSIPKKLDEEYRRPNERVIDNIGIIEDTDELEDALEEFNDVTGICPIVYTMYVEDYVDRYADLESFAYDKYVDSYLDEQHYLVVYAIPEDQVEPFMSRQLEVPDFEFEVMQGDDTDAIMTEGRDRFFVHNVQSNLDNGCEVGATFSTIFEEMSDDCAHDLKSPARFKALLPLLIVIGFFILPIVFMIKAYINEKNMDIEEVPLADEDVKAASGMRSGVPTGAEAAATNAAKAVALVMLAIFGCIGLGILIRGIFMLKDGMIGFFLIGFGALWTLAIAGSAIGTLKALKNTGKNNNPLTAEYPKAEMPHADYPQADYPKQADTSSSDSGSFSEPIWNRTSTYEDDDDDLRRKGYE